MSDETVYNKAASQVEARLKNYEDGVTQRVYGVRQDLQNAVKGFQTAKGAAQTAAQRANAAAYRAHSQEQLAARDQATAQQQEQKAQHEAQVAVVTQARARSEEHSLAESSQQLKLQKEQFDRQRGLAHEEEARTDQALHHRASQEEATAQQESAEEHRLRMVREAESREKSVLDKEASHLQRAAEKQKMQETTISRQMAAMRVEQRELARQQGINKAAVEGEDHIRMAIRGENGKIHNVAPYVGAAAAAGAAGGLGAASTADSAYNGALYHELSSAQEAVRQAAQEQHMADIRYGATWRSMAAERSEEDLENHIGNMPAGPYGEGYGSGMLPSEFSAPPVIDGQLVPPAVEAKTQTQAQRIVPPAQTKQIANIGRTFHKEATAEEADAQQAATQQATDVKSKTAKAVQMPAVKNKAKKTVMVATTPTAVKAVPKKPHASHQAIKKAAEEEANDLLKEAQNARRATKDDASPDAIVDEDDFVVPL